jgi:CRP-like cAMP-binding protein
MDPGEGLPRSSLLRDPEQAEVAGVATASLSDDDRIRHLERVPLFSGCNKGELYRIARIARVLQAKAGTALTRIGEPGDSFFIIVDGRVGVQTQAGIGAELYPCDFFGEMSLLDGERRSATVTATTDVLLLVVERGNFWRLLDEAPEVIRRILVVLSRRVRRLEQAANELRRGTV